MCVCESVNAKKSEIETESVCVCVCAREREREIKCVCVCEREKESLFQLFLVRVVHSCDLALQPVDHLRKGERE